MTHKTTFSSETPVYFEKYKNKSQLIFEKYVFGNLEILDIERSICGEEARASKSLRSVLLFRKAWIWDQYRQENMPLHLFKGQLNKFAFAFV